MPQCSVAGGFFAVIYVSLVMTFGVVRKTDQRLVEWVCRARQSTGLTSYAAAEVPSVARERTGPTRMSQSCLRALSAAWPSALPKPFLSSPAQDAGPSSLLSRQIGHLLGPGHTEHRTSVIESPDRRRHQYSLSGRAEIVGPAVSCGGIERQ